MPESDYDLSSEFQVTMLQHQIDQLEYIEEVKKVAKELVQLNAQMKSTFNTLVCRGWIDDNIEHRL